MKSLIVEDDFTARLILQRFLEPYGENQLAVNGNEAIQAFLLARKEGKPYDLICLDIMMPGMDGQEVLTKIRSLEEDEGILRGDGVKILMTTALGDKDNVFRAFRQSCDGYLVKPFDKSKVVEQLQLFGLLS